MDDLELIKQKINIVDLIQEYLPLKKAGVNFKAPCPFHQERTPSFVVSPERGIWKCFGCQKGGDIFKFLMEKEGIEFPEALEILAKRAGVALKRSNQGNKDKKEHLLEANVKAAQFYHFILTKHKLGKKALEYLKKRGLSDKTIEEFNLGYAPNSWESLTSFLLKRGFKLPDLIEVGLTVPSKSGGYDRFRGRIVFPLYDLKGQVIGFSGRVLGKGEPKYINSPQTVLFDKSHFLFGLQLSKGAIRNSKSVILTEGEMDMILSYQAGVKNVVASKGTALTLGQVELIKRFADNILLCFDHDLAGDMAARRGIELADQAGLNIRIIELSGGKDPAEMVNHDVKLWSEAVEKAEPIYDYYLRSASLRFNSKTAEGKKNVASELLPILAKISDSVTLEHYLQKLSALISTPEELLRREINKLKKMSIQDYQIVLKEPVRGEAEVKSRQRLLEEYLMALLLKIPSDLVFVPSFPETIFLSEELRSLYVLLVVYLDSISFTAHQFKISQFVQTLPKEIVSTVDNLYLTELEDSLSDSKNWQKELVMVVGEIKKLLLKNSLAKLSSDIKNAESFGKIELLKNLNRRFRDLSVRLKNL